jgi:hypothetical protein
VSTPEWARPYLGVPYAEANCWEITRRVLWNRAAIRVPDFSGEYDRDADEAGWADHVRDEVESLVERELAGDDWRAVVGAVRPFDVALYRAIVRDGSGTLVVRRHAHIGVVIAPGLGISTSRATGSYLYRLGMRQWAAQLEGYWRHVGPS